MRGDSGRHVYRFLGTPGPDTHVCTADRRECRLLGVTGHWLYEGSAFLAAPVNMQGGCEGFDDAPLYRVWRPFGNSTHRLTSQRGVVAQMVAEGWIDEGIAMCVAK